MYTGSKSTFQSELMMSSNNSIELLISGVFVVSTVKETDA
jgi:hypothetical protein